MYTQRPTPPNEWLYSDNEKGERYFFEIACLPSEEMKFPECTDAEKEEWEREHPAPEPEPEPESE